MRVLSHPGRGAGRSAGQSRGSCRCSPIVGSRQTSHPHQPNRAKARLRPVKPPARLNSRQEARLSGRCSSRSSRRPTGRGTPRECPAVRMRRTSGGRNCRRRSEGCGAAVDDPERGVGGAVLQRGRLLVFELLRVEELDLLAEELPGHARPVEGDQARRDRRVLQGELQEHSGTLFSDSSLLQQLPVASTEPEGEQQQRHQPRPETGTDPTAHELTEQRRDERGGGSRGLAGSLHRAVTYVTDEAHARGRARQTKPAGPMSRAACCAADLSLAAPSMLSSPTRALSASSRPPPPAGPCTPRPGQRWRRPRLHLAFRPLAPVPDAVHRATTPTPRARPVTACQICDTA